MTCMDEQSALRPPPLLRTPGGARTRTSYLLSTPSSTSSSTVSGRGGEGRGGEEGERGEEEVCVRTHPHTRQQSREILKNDRE
jgi:hypothetical protein